MSLTTKNVGDPVAVYFDGDFVRLSVVSESSPGVYVVDGMYFSVAGVGRGRLEVGYEVHDPSQDDIDRDAALVAVAQLHRCNWSQMSTSDLQTVAALTAAHVPGAGGNG